MVFCALSLQFALAAGISNHWDGDKSIPKDVDLTGTVKAVDIATQFVLAFDAVPSITGSGGTLAVYKDGSLIKTIPIRTDNPDVSIVGKTIVVKHGITSFTEGSMYEIVLPVGAVKVPTNVDALIAPGVWQVRISDLTAPALRAEVANQPLTKPLVPVGVGTAATLKNAANVRYEDPFNIILRFTEPVQKGSGKIAIYNAAGTVVEIIEASSLVAGNFSNGGKDVTIEVSDNAKFEENTTYYVKVEKGAFKDMADQFANESANLFAGINDNTTWTFTTRDNSAPSITASVSSIGTTTAKLNVAIAEAGKIYYASNATGVAPGFPGVAWTTVIDVAANTTKVFDLSGLSSGVKNYAYIYSENSLGNVSGSVKTIEFTTIDNQGPRTFANRFDGLVAVPGRGLITTTVANPVAGGDSLKQTTGIYIYFDEDVMGGTNTTLDVRKKSDQSFVFQVPSSAVKCTKITKVGDFWEGKYKATVDFGGALASGTDYYIVFQEGFFTDKSDKKNPYKNEAANTLPLGYPVPQYVNAVNDWVVTSSDYEPAVVTFSTDTKTTQTAGDIVDAGRLDNIYINFNEAVSPTKDAAWDGTNSFAFWSKYVALQLDGVTVPAAFSIDVANKVITINPDNANPNGGLEYGKTYTVILRPRSVKDVTGNSNVVAPEKRINVTVADGVALAAKFAPTSNLGEFTPLTITFTKSVRAITAGGFEALTTANVAPKVTLTKNFNVVDPAGVDGSAAIDPSKYSVVYASRKITVTPNADTPFNITNTDTIYSYTLAVADGFIEEDPSGVDLNGITYTYNFIDKVAPKGTLVASTITVGTPLTIKYNEKISTIGGAPVSSLIVLKNTNAEGTNIPFTAAIDNPGTEKIITITPTGGPLAAGTYYYAIGKSIQDQNLNAAPAYSKVFKVVPVTLADTINAVSINVNGVAANMTKYRTVGAVLSHCSDTIRNVVRDGSGDVTIKVNFDETVQLGTLTNVIEPILGNIALIGTNVSDRVLTFKLNAGVLASEQYYTLTLPINTIESNVNDAISGVKKQLNSPIVLVFESKDIVKPGAVTSPIVANLDGAGDVALDAKLTIDFAEKVAIVPGKQIKFTPAGGSPENTISISSSNVVVDNAANFTWEIKHSNWLKSNTVYTVDVPAGAFKDEANNDNEAYSFSFTTQYNRQPKVAAAAGSLSPADGQDLVGQNIDLTMTFTEDVKIGEVLDPLARKVVYVIKRSKKAGVVQRSIDGTGALLPVPATNCDTITYQAYVDDALKVTVSGNTVNIKGVTLEANNEYYVLINSGAFVDKSTGVNAAADVNGNGPIPGVYTGIDTYGPWNFYTKDLNAADWSISFDQLDPEDGLPLPTSNIKVKFTKPIFKNIGGTKSAILNTDINDATNPLIQLYKESDLANDIKFTATIVNENEITINNSSLVFLNEMKQNTQYRVVVSNKVIGRYSGTSVNTTGLANGKKFRTTDYDKPTTPVIVFKSNNEQTAIGNVNGVNEAIFTFTTSDVNSISLGISEPADTVYNNVVLHYFKSDLDLSLSGADAWNIAGENKFFTDNAAAGAGYDKNFKGGSESEKDFWIYAVAKDHAGNYSDVAKKKYTTDDIVKPELAVARPTALDASNKLLFTFNEEVGVANAGVSYARIIDKTNMRTYTVLLEDFLAGADAAKKKTIITQACPVALDVTDYIVEIDGGMVVDVPRLAGDTKNAWIGIVGTQYTVSSVDKTKPQLKNPAHATLAIAKTVSSVPTVGLKFNEAVKLNSSFASISVKDALNNPYDLLTASNITGLGTDSLTFTFNRPYVSNQTYTFTIANGSFEDMNGNVWDNTGAIVVTLSVGDVVPLAGAVWSAGANVAPFNNALVQGFSTLDIDFNENFYLSDKTDANINAYDLQSHVYIKEVGGNNLSFVATVFAADQIRLTVTAADLKKGKTYEFGYTNLYDNNKNLKASESKQFTIQTDALASLKFVPGFNDVDPATVKVIDVKPELSIEFNGLIYSYNFAVEALNNLIIDAKWLNDNGVFTMPGTTGFAVSSLDVVNGKHVVRFKVDALTSGANYTLSIVDNKIQIGQGLNPIVGASEPYVAADVKAPSLAYKDVNGVATNQSYNGTNGVVVTPSTELGLIFDEKVEGKGNLEIRRFDGILVATVDLTGKKSATDVAGHLLENYMKIAKISDLMTASNPDFKTATSYYVVIANGSIKDLAGNAYAGISAINEWKFELRDDNRPVPTFVNAGQIDLSVNPTLRFAFDRKIDNGTGGFLALYTEGGIAYKLLRNVDAALPVANSVLEYDVPLTALAPNTKYYVELGEGTALLDADGTTPMKAVRDANWYFSTEINANPKVITYVPGKTTPMTTGVELTSDLVITFDQPIVAGIGNIQLHKKQTAGGPIITNFNVADGTKVIISGNKVTVPSSVLGLTENSEYYVIIPATAIRNASPTVEYYAGIVTPFEWSFSTIADRTAPTVIAAAAAQTGLGDNKTKFDVTLTFNEDVNYVNAGSVTATNATIVISEVTAKRVYNVAVTAADLANVKISLSDSIKDQLNNRLVPVSFDYKVADNNKPLVAATTTATSIANSIFDVKLTFNEIVKNVASSLSVNGGAKILSVSPDSGAVYTVKIDATTATATVLAISKDVVDLAGNKFDGASFTYGTAKVPTVVALTPRDGSGIDSNKLKEAAKRNPVLSIEFSENVVSAGNPNLFVSLYKMKEDGTVLGKVFQSTVPAEFSGRILNVPVLVDLEDDVNYVVLVDAGIVKSDFGLAFAGILNPTSWNFKAGDNTAPVLTITNDQVAPLNAKSKINLTLTFADKSGIVEGVANAVKVVGASNSPVPVKVNNLKYTLALEAADLADVVVTVDSTITDKDGRNTLVAPQVVTFKVGDNTAPTVAIAGTVVKNTIAATLTFSEVVKNVTDVTVTATNIIGKPVIAAADTTGKVYTATMEAADNASVVLTANAEIVDNNGNKLVVNSAEFKVNDNTAPVAVYTASKLASNFVVNVAFDEVVNGVDSAITVIGGTYELLQPVGNTYPVAIAAKASTVTLTVSNKVKDASGNAYAGASKTYFTSAVASVTPASGTTGLTNTFDVLVAFNDGVVVPNDGVFSVSSNATASKALPLVGNKYQITITAKDMEVVTLTISDAVKDAMGNTFAAAEYVYTIGDNSAPYVVVGGYSPADGDFDVKNPLSLELTFNENVVAGATASKVKVYEQTVSNKNQLVFETSINSDMIEGNVVTIPVAYRLIDNTAYTVTIDNGIVKDSSNNVFKEGFVDPTRWNFSTGDNTAPVIVSVTPETATAAKNIFDVTVVFTKDVVRVAENITAKNGEVVSVKGAGKTWVATISAADGAVVDVTIGTGVIDAALRNTLATAVTKTYTVGDNTAPTLVVTDPKAPVAATFTVGLAFSEVVTGVVADAIVVSNGTIKSVAGAGKDYTLTIVAAEESVVGISIPSTIADATGNKFAGKTLEYKVGDFTAPVVAGVVSGEGHDVKVVLTFSTDAIVAEGDITVKGAASAATITNVANVYTINTTIADKSTVVVSVSPNVVDEAGNKIAGILDFSKTIGDITAPTVMIDPVAAKDTLNQFDVTLVFSESVQNVESSISVNAPATAVVESYLNHTVFKVLINAPDLATVKMVVSDQIVDAAGNKFLGGTFTYTIGDHSSPTVTGVSTVTGNDVKVVLTFSADAIVKTSDITVTGATSSNVTNVGNVYTVTAKANDLATVVVKVSEAIVDVDGNKITGNTTFSNTIVDNTKPVVSVVAATINNVDGTASITSSEVSAVYLVDATVALTKDAVIAALAAKKAVAGYVAVANQAVVVSAAGLVPGSYQAVAIDASGNVGVSTQKVTVEEPIKYQVVTIAKIQGTGANSPLANETVVTSGVVTGVDAAKKGFFMQDASKAWSGIYVADATLAAQVNIGTGVKVTGKVAESNGLTQIGNVIASEFVALGLDIVPVAVTTDKAAAEQYESVYVVFADGDNGIATAVDANKEWTIKTNAGTTVKIDDQLFAYSPKAGMRYAVNGIVNYTSGEFKVAPRNSGDVKDLTSAPELSSEFKVYPTLFDNVINIKSTSEVRLTKAVFTNIAGQVVKEVINPESVISTSELRSGVYFLSLHTENGVAKTERIIKR
jgi:hypothetical protein